ncbi:hypothetical protein GCM10023081_39690 [Arthrobacter ginkgonis]|uniref:Uncharacterized protein n=1 Tax=Arthrobacter ginkgonis TaxID=1630594 RepID=A0ABP7D2X0_9MICC
MPVLPGRPFRRLLPAAVPDPHPVPPAGFGSGTGHSSAANERLAPRRPPRSRTTVRGPTLPAQGVSPKEIRVVPKCLGACRVFRFSPADQGARIEPVLPP